MNKWVYDEYKHCGVDYSAAKQAEMYDNQHQKFRDYKNEFKEMMNYIGLQNTENKKLIDLGCGTGATSIFAARLFSTVYAVDVSEAMLEQAKKKVKGNIDNIEFIKAGFLSYEHEGELVDLIITKAAIHHLPDFWKQVALLRMNEMLKMGGLLYIHDVVFNFEPQEYVDTIKQWINTFSNMVGEEFKTEAEIHIREEYSTYGWIMSGMIERAGFAIEKSRISDLFVTEYVCRKIGLQ
jgi:ubiquinone/menaquinone biosynthesis C-methylase UbiE